MIDFDYNYLSRVRDTRGREAEYTERLKAEYYARQQREIQNEGVVSVNKSIRVSGELLRDAVDDFNESLSEQYEQLNGSLEGIGEHLEDISADLNHISNELSNISGILDWGFGQVIENQRLTLLVLTTMEDLLRVSDNEKERVMRIKRGIAKQQEAFYSPKLYRNAISYYEEALEFFKEDPFVLTRLGIIYLSAVGEVDFEKAAMYLERAVAYVLPLYYSKRNLDDSAIYDDTSGLLAPMLFKNLRQQAAITLFHAARAKLLLGDPLQARDDLTEALQIAPEFNEAQYLLIKVTLLAGNPAELPKLINGLLTTSPYYYFKFRRDQFFVPYPVIGEQVEKYRLELLEFIKREIEEIRAIVTEGSRFGKQFKIVLAHFRTAHFLGLVKAKKLLERSASVEFKCLQYEA